VKIIATVYDGTNAVHIGGGVESQSVVLADIEDSKLPALVQAYLKYRRGHNNYLSLSLSFALPDAKEKEDADI